MNRNSLSTNVVLSGSMLDQAIKNKQELALSWVDCEMLILCDSSGSMSERDSRGGQSRFEILRVELTRLQKENPGKIAVVSFSTTVQWCQGGDPIYLGDRTNMVAALEFAKEHDAMDRAIVMISDGEPDSPDETLKLAKTFKTHIDTIYVGPEDGKYRGRDFLLKLSSQTGGKHQDDFSVNQLASKIVGLLGTGSGDTVISV